MQKKFSGIESDVWLKVMLDSNPLFALSVATHLKRATVLYSTHLRKFTGQLKLTVCVQTQLIYYLLRVWLLTANISSQSSEARSSFRVYNLCESALASKLAETWMLLVKSNLWLHFNLKDFKTSISFVYFGQFCGFVMRYSTFFA